MSTRKILLGILLVGMLGLLASLLIYRYGASETAAPDASFLIPQYTRLPEFSLPNLQGTPMNSSQWAGQVLVLNFWATWCGPCQQEIPLFMELQRKLGSQGVQFVGIAIDDPEAVRSFAKQQAINYPILLGAEDAIALSQQLGNRIQGLPFSVIFDRTGRLAHTHIGELKRGPLEDKLGLLLR